MPIKLSDICSHLGIARYRVDQWLHRGVFNPQNETIPGKAREYTFRDAMILSVMNDLSDATLTFDGIASGSGDAIIVALSKVNIHHGFYDDDTVLVVSFSDIPMADDKRTPVRMPGILQAKVIRKRELADHIFNLRNHVTVSIPLNRHEERMKPLFENGDV